MAELLDVDAFVARSRTLPVLDARTPAEFAQGHIPGALNLPLFSDAERAEIGTLYKQAGRDAALLRGLDLVGPRLRALVEEARRHAPGGEALVHCWRGGMRSESLAWLLAFSGLRVHTLRGGYKAFRRYVLASFERPRPLVVLSGPTGTGKTDVLHALARRSEQVLDLEALAHHRGSVFGGLGEAPQPTQEHFENRLALRWRALDPTRPAWVEDESRRIGALSLPGGLWQQMQAADACVLDVPLETRVAHLTETYGRHDPDALREAIQAIRRRLGGARTKAALAALDRGDLPEACRLTLHYYDRAYTHSFSRRPAGAVHRLDGCRHATPEARAAALLKAVLTTDGVADRI